MNKNINSKMITFICLIIVAGYSIMGLINYNSYSKIIKDDTLNITKLTAMNIYSEIQNELTKPIFVSLTMANDTFLKNWINNEGNENITDVTNYLKGIKEKYNYSSSFLVSSNTNNYYHWDGILKQVSVEDKHDIWYYDFIKKNIDYDIDVDTDEANGNTLSVFINCKIKNDNDDMIGVTGVGLEMSQIQGILNYYNNLLDVDTYLINKDGVIQVYADETYIEQTNLFDNKDFKDSKFKILNNKNGIQLVKLSNSIDGYYAISRYIDDLDWYLIATKNTTDLYNSFLEQLFIDFIITSIVILLVIMIVIRIIKFYQLKVNSLISTDALTGLNNRRSMDIILEERTKEYDKESKIFSVFIIDIDNFKNINDSMGHVLGDEVIRTVAKVVNENIGHNNSICRWGGDEFVGIINDEIKKSIDIIKRMQNKISEESFLNEHEITISIGVTEYKEGLSIDEVLNNADSALYSAKEKGKNNIEIFDSE